MYPDSTGIHTMSQFLSGSGCAWSANMIHNVNFNFTHVAVYGYDLQIKVHFTELYSLIFH